MTTDSATVTALHTKPVVSELFILSILVHNSRLCVHSLHLSFCIDATTLFCLCKAHRMNSIFMIFFLFVFEHWGKNSTLHICGRANSTASAICCFASGSLKWHNLWYICLIFQFLLFLEGILRVSAHKPFVNKTWKKSDKIILMHPKNKTSVKKPDVLSIHNYFPQTSWFTC